MTKKAHGTCRLTGKHGQFVRSHLLPKALTRTPVGNEARVDGYDGARPVRRTDSWYDPAIVTRSGEDILTFYDTAAIRTFRDQNLIWNIHQQEVSTVAGVINDQVEIRTAQCRDTGKLRLFFLSLLWRAAVTTLKGYRIELTDNKVEKLRQMLLARDPTPLSFFPVVLTQLNTQGPWHNAGPRRLQLPPGQNETEGNSFIRFYFQGLIAHIYEDETGKMASGLGDLAVGNTADLVFYSRPFEGSAQEVWLKNLLMHNLAEHYDIVERIFGSREKPR